MIDTLTHGGRTPQTMLTIRDSYASDSADNQPMVFASGSLCFPHRVPSDSYWREVAPMELRVSRLKNSLSELSESQLTALGRLLPCLLCGEESAFHVFWQEGHRVSNVQASYSQTLANRIAVDELEHERLLQDLVAVVPCLATRRAHYSKHVDSFCGWQAEILQFTLPE